MFWRFKSCGPWMKDLLSSFLVTSSYQYISYKYMSHRKPPSKANRNLNLQKQTLASLKHPLHTSCSVPHFSGTYSGWASFLLPSLVSRENVESEWLRCSVAKLPQTLSSLPALHHLSQFRQVRWKLGPKMNRYKWGDIWGPYKWPQMGDWGYNPYKWPYK